MTDSQRVPRTAAGQALVDYPFATAGIGSDRDDDAIRKAILAIEAEAAELDVDRLARAIQDACDRLHLWSLTRDHATEIAAAYREARGEIGEPPPGGGTG